MTIDRDTDPGRRMITAARMRRRPSRTVVLLGIALFVCGCAAFPSSDGDRRAETAADGVADQVGSQSANAPEITLLEMVAWWVPDGPIAATPGTAVVEPLAWSGESAGSQATIDIRVTVEVPAKSATQIFGDSWDAGSATRCYRLEWEQYESARRSEIPCPDGTPPVRPTPAPRPEFSQADRERVVEIIASHVSARDVDLALHDAYPQEYMSIETVSADGGVVAAVGIPAERDCILVFRDAAGAITFPEFRRISLEPGEAGCSTTLYTSPPF